MLYFITPLIDNNANSLYETFTLFFIKSLESQTNSKFKVLFVITNKTKNDSIKFIDILSKSSIRYSVIEFNEEIDNNENFIKAIPRDCSIEVKLNINDAVGKNFVKYCYEFKPKQRGRYFFNTFIIYNTKTSYFAKVKPASRECSIIYRNQRKNVVHWFSRDNYQKRSPVISKNLIYLSCNYKRLLMTRIDILTNTDIELLCDEFDYLHIFDKVD